MPFTCQWFIYCIGMFPFMPLLFLNIISLQEYECQQFYMCVCVCRVAKMSIANFSICISLLFVWHCLDSLASNFAHPRANYALCLLWFHCPLVVCGKSSKLINKTAGRSTRRAIQRFYLCKFVILFALTLSVSIC